MEILLINNIRLYMPTTTKKRLNMKYYTHPSIQQDKIHYLLHSEMLSLYTAQNAFKCSVFLKIKLANENFKMEIRPGSCFKIL